MIIIKILEKDIKDVEFFYTLNFICKFKDSNNFSLFKSQTMGWIIWNFIEQMVLITYIIRTFFKSIKEKIKMEILSFFFLWYIYSFICTFISFYINKNKSKEDSMNLIVIIISICFHYICLVINGYFPLFLSYHYKTAISYHLVQN